MSACSDQGRTFCLCHRTWKSWAPGGSQGHDSHKIECIRSKPANPSLWAPAHPATTSVSCNLYSQVIPSPWVCLGLQQSLSILQLEKQRCCSEVRFVCSLKPRKLFSWLYQERSSLCKSVRLPKSGRVLSSLHWFVSSLFSNLGWECQWRPLYGGRGFAILSTWKGLATSLPSSNDIRTLTSSFLHYQNRETVLDTH